MTRSKGEQCLINDNYIVNFHEQVVQSKLTGLRTVLGSNEIALLRYFIDHSDITLTRQELLDKIWTSRGMVVEDSSLMNSVSVCRKAFEDKKGQVIRTERGVGYRFVAKVETIVEERFPSSENKQKTRYSWLPYVLISVLFAMLIFFFLRSQPLQDADEFLVGKYMKCILTPSSGEATREYFNASVYQVDNEKILIDEDGRSLSYAASATEVACE
ncbi:winged helix-turn-helix domain-containing protein [Photobacterium atrarenae]|uniref:Winged helix-turn-helix domain-containing protein n=1 Tax=Photobacterium atrarenae TaxID=865757 RepID=A0ABY5GJD4_9GAMM|nr:winged helix-turn-helix domain-containing protein [Photobacterium atrarenae]UTV28453.1 winged helix-turn-helix domain-containing protein [Photobacterium atrarenae]